jgi:hypothetical protein
VAKVGTFRKTGNSTISLWRKPHWLQCFQGAKCGTGPQSKIIIIHDYYLVRSFRQLLAENVNNCFYECVPSDDGPIGPETYRSWCVVIL